MTYLDIERLEGIDEIAFQSRKPYPWVSAEGPLTDQGYRRLLDTLPDLSQFKRQFGIKRAHGQKSHDRFGLEYHEDVNVSEAWHEVIEELRGKTYRDFLQRLFGRRSLKLNFHWHYTPRGCSVSPHCDAKHKLGSHIFYFNTDRDWDPSWGGQTLILDDGGRFNRRSAPKFEDFERVTATQALGNCSLLFSRRKKSWHGVRALRCPDRMFRKVFIVVITDGSLRRRVIMRLRGKKIATY